VSGPPRLWHEEMTARFARGTFARMRAVLRKHESKTDLVRGAIEAELQKREEEQRRERAVARVAGWIG